MDAVDTIALVSDTAHDLSVWGLFLQADLVVKAVMLILLVASIWCWAIILDKSARLRGAERKADAFEARFWSGESLDGLYDTLRQNPPDPMSAAFCAGMAEWRMGQHGGGARDAALRASLLQRVDRAIAVENARQMDRLEAAMTVLATTGSAAPFLGLFGTVWGIMNSFTAIAASQNTNLAVVAPGIAEALFATAIGLFAAIPATIAYNLFATDLSRFGGRLDGFADKFSAILSRYLESQGAGRAGQGDKAA